MKVKNLKNSLGDHKESDFFLKNLVNFQNRLTFLRVEDFYILLNLRFSKS